MKQLFLLGVSLLAVSACAPQSPPPPTPMGQAVPAPTATNNTTAAFDGNYGNPVIASKSPPGCPDLGALPNWTINNGLAALQGPNLGFGGYVSPTGALALSSSTGQSFQWQIDPHFVLSGRLFGPNCAYNVSWTRMS